MGWNDRRTLKRDYSSPEYRRNRTLALDRDGWCCVLCGTPTKTVDHIDRSRGHELTNLRALCAGRGSCHARKTATESAASRPRRERDPERHPGLVRL